MDRSHCSREKWLPTQSTAPRLIEPRVRTQLLSRTSQWSRGRKPSSWRWPTTRFTGPYHRHAIGMFNTCSWGPTEQPLIDTGGGYNLGGAGSPHIHSPIFPTSCLPFSLVAPPDLHFNQVSLIKAKCWVLNNLWPPHGLSTTWPSTVAYIYA
jgi:hypothetical protein